jgi:hypothetical protein
LRQYSSNGSNCAQVHTLTFESYGDRREKHAAIARRTCTAGRGFCTFGRSESFLREHP